MVRAYRRPRTTAHEDIARFEDATYVHRGDLRWSRGVADTLNRVPPNLHDRVTAGIGFDKFGLTSKEMMYIDVRNFNNRVKSGVEAYVSWGSITHSVHGMGTILEVQVDNKDYAFGRQNALVLVDFDGVQAWVEGWQITAVVR